ncbi:hypothetical protein ACFL2Q_09420 [Thermodesulfobacteriota bacterium]
MDDKGRPSSITNGISRDARISAIKEIPRPGIDQIIEDLASESPEKRKKATKRLVRLAKSGLTLEEDRTALEAATHSFPPHDSEHDETAYKLVKAVAVHPRKEYIPLIKEFFPQYSPRSRWFALQLLAKLPEREAAQAFVDLALKYGRDGGTAGIPTDNIERNLRFPKVFFPRIVQLAEDRALEGTIYILTLSYLRKQLIGKQDLK